MIDPTAIESGSVFRSALTLIVPWLPAVGPVSFRLVSLELPINDQGCTQRMIRGSQERRPCNTFEAGTALKEGQ